MFRLQNVATKRRDRISSDEEERLRMGYEIASGIRYKEVAGRRVCQVAQVTADGETILNLSYGDAATIWRINLGWRRRANRHQLGFILDTERGYWQSRNNLADDDDPDDPLSAKTQRVVPFVEDRRNCMLIEPVANLSLEQLASFQAIIKKSIQGLYQLEDNELATEPLPSSDNRKRILIYESAEGGAGVLRRLLENPKSMAELATESLRLCHYDPSDGTDLKRAAGAAEDCEAACYDCLLSYSNQRDHSLLDREQLKDFLLKMKDSTVIYSPSGDTFAVHLEKLKQKCDSSLEIAWLDFLVSYGFNLPTSSQKYFERAQTRPDFQFEQHKVMVYIDGPIHDFPDRQRRDAEKTMLLDDMDYTVLRFSHQDSWLEITSQFPNVFGVRKPSFASQSNKDMASSKPFLDLDLFPSTWQDIVQQLCDVSQLSIESGGDIESDGRVIGSYVLLVGRGDKQLFVFDVADENHSKAIEHLKSEGKSTLAINPVEPQAASVISKELGAS